jgi:hypothetical protein
MRDENKIKPKPKLSMRDRLKDYYRRVKTNARLTYIFTKYRIRLFINRFI